MRRAGVAMDLLAGHWQPEQIAIAVRGPRRKKWPRGLEHAGGPAVRRALDADRCVEIPEDRELAVNGRSEEHTSELQSLMRISYAVFCLKKKQITKRNNKT